MNSDLTSANIYQREVQFIITQVKLISELGSLLINKE